MKESLKILHLSTHLNIGGITTYILEAGRELRKRGHEVLVLSAGGECEDVFVKSGLRISKFPIRTKSVLSPKILFAIPRIISLVRREKITLMHAHSRVTQVLARVVSFFTRVPYISTAHGFYRRRLGRRLFPAWGKRVIAISPLVAEELQKTHRVDPSRIRVVYNGLEIEERRRCLLEQNPYEIRRCLGFDEKSFVIGSVSRLVRDKGHEYLVEAVSRLRKKGKDVTLLIVGDGRERRS